MSDYKEGENDCSLCLEEKLSIMEYPNADKLLN